MGENGPFDFWSSANDTDLVAYARFLLKTAGRRAEVSGDLKLTNGQWNILLDLFISAAEHRIVPTGDACLVSGAPHSTGLRYVIALEDRGYVARTADPDDARRTLIGLTAEGQAFVNETLSVEYEALTAMIDQRRG